jgi:protein gp37
MIDIAKGRYWDLPWSLVDGCTPCSPGCDHCWSAAMAHRFVKTKWDLPKKPQFRLTGPDGKFDGYIQIHPERFDIPRKRKKPTVYAVWNDFWHEDVVDDFQYRAFEMMADRHTFLILTKRPEVAAAFFREGKQGEELTFDNIYFGLTVCNQVEVDEKIPVFLQVPGKKFLSIEPMLGEIDLRSALHTRRRNDCFWIGFDDEITDESKDEEPICPACGGDNVAWRMDCLWNPGVSGAEAHERYMAEKYSPIDAVILGGETGPGARPLHPNWARSIRDQCAAAGVPFFFKGWGKNIPDLSVGFGDLALHPSDIPEGGWDRLLDGRTHDELPWVTP